VNHEQSYELYRQLSAAQTDVTKAGPALAALLAAFQAASSNAEQRTEWLAGADDCLHVIAGNSQLFVAAISTWLVDTGSAALAKAVVHEASVRHLQQPGAEFYKLEGVPEADAVLCAYRLCALNATPAVSLGWTLSLGVAFPSFPATQSALMELLRFHMDEFPNTTLRLLSVDGSPFAAVELVSAALAALKGDDKWLDEQPRLREFAMTPEMRLTLSSLKRSENRAIQQSSRENSIFAQIFTTQHFKYANKTAVEFNVGSGVQETTLEMSSYGLSVELPLSEGTDPVSGANRRRELARGPSK
jgi:hypothetical protein